jgi:hypothetical protein
VSSSRSSRSECISRLGCRWSVHRTVSLRTSGRPDVPSCEMCLYPPLILEGLSSMSLIADNGVALFVSLIHLTSFPKTGAFLVQTLLSKFYDKPYHQRTSCPQTLLASRLPHPRNHGHAWSLYCYSGWLDHGRHLKLLSHLQCQVRNKAATLLVNVDQTTGPDQKAMQAVANSIEDMLELEAIGCDVNSPEIVSRSLKDLLSRSRKQSWSELYS